MDIKILNEFVNRSWEGSALPELMEYIRIPNKSPAFAPDWQALGHMDRAVDRFVNWCERQNVEGLQLEVLRLQDRTPLIYMDIPGDGDGNILLYGHLDKQPEMTGWREGLGPWEPVMQGDRLYGRGGADDGYATFASLIAVKALQAQGIVHPRCTVIIEACEESGSYDLPYYIDALKDRIDKPELVICLDSGCGNYDQLWNTTSLRGLVGGELKVEILTEGVHSGDAGGIVPSSFRILRQILNRIEDPDTGVIGAADFHAPVPGQRLEQARRAAAVLGGSVSSRFPFVSGARAASEDPAELILNRTWRPALAVTGAGGLPAMDNAGNVLRPQTSVRISLRLPPTCNPDKAAAKLKSLLEDNPPYGAKVSFKPDWRASGWHAPAMSPWLEAAIDRASRNHFGKPAMHMGEGGTIPFMGMLGNKFPEAQFLITGVLGPQANAHGPNEFLHVPTAKKLTACVAEVIAGMNMRREA